jgi:hypothetical protein
MTKAALLVAGVAIAPCLAGQAQAGTVTKSFQFSASGFPTGAPQQTVMGKFTFTYDDNGGRQKAIVPDAVDLVINGVAYTPKNTTVDVWSNGVLEFDTFPDNDNAPWNSLDGRSTGKDAFAVMIDRFDSQPQPGVFYYTVPGKPTFQADKFSVSEITAQ